MSRALTVTLASFGTRGDVQPFLALGRALRASGHQVTLCAPPDYTAQAAAQDLAFVPAGDPYAALMAELRSSPTRIAALMARQIPAQLTALEPLVQASDAVISGSLEFATPTLCEQHGVARRAVLLSPCMVPSGGWPMPVVPAYGLPRWMNRLTWWLSDLITGGTMLGPLVAERKRRGLPPLGRAAAHVCGEEIWLPFPGSIAGFGDPLAAEVRQLPPWFLPDESPLPSNVAAFLEAGDPPIFFGLGCMPGDRTWPAVFAAGAAAAGHRALIATAHPCELDPAQALAVSTPLNHGALFPGCAALVHHGGAGTFLQATLAARPQLVLPKIADQHFHGWRAEGLGLGRRLARKRVSAEAIAAALTEVLALPGDTLEAVAASIPTDGALRSTALVARLPK